MIRFRGMITAAGAGIVTLAGVSVAAAQAPQQWTNATEMTVSRETFTTTLLPDGRVLAAGGFSDGRGDSTELFDPVRNQWTASGLMAASRNGHGAVLLQDGR